MSSRDTKPSWLARLSVATILLLVTACQDYAARRDTIAFHAGESAAYNKAIHTIDPWPAASARTDLPLEGTRAIRAIERYETGDIVAVPAPGVTGAPVNTPAASASPPR